MKSNKTVFHLLVALFLSMGLFVGCSNDDEGDDDHGDGEEVISRVILTFTPEHADEFETVTATWLDEDGEGTGAPTIDPITLIEGAEYVLTMELTNTLETPPEDITGEIDEEAEDHMFFFAFTDGIFGDPAGNGNVDNRGDAVNYNDQDSNGQPLGLSTTWTAGEHTESAGEFTVILKHQPDGQKTATSDVNVGGTDVDITFPLNIEEDPNAEEEVINEVVLTFTPAGGGDAITATWFDEDGEGVGNPTIDDINLAADTEYEMSITLANTLEDPAEDITEEIAEEDDEHMFFFEFTADIFADPAGNGNVDSRDSPLNYNDQDANMLPVGLSTQWTTGGATSTAGALRIMLKHVPGGIKTETSDATVGGTDVDIEFAINIQ